MSDTANNRLIAKNTLVLFFRMLLTVCIGLYTSRVVLNTLGIVDFGLYNVVGGLVAMFGFIRSTMTAGSQRFITFALGKGDDSEINKVFSTSIIIHVITALVVLILVETIGLWFLYHKMVIPPDRFSAAQMVFHCAIVSMIVVIVCVPYNALIIAKERMTMFAYIAMLEVSLKLLIVYLLGIGGIDKLAMYAVLMLLVEVLVQLCYYIYCRRHFVESKFRFVFDKPLFMKILKFSSWTLNGNLAMIAATQGINILLNIFFGPAVNAARGISVQVQNKVFDFCSNFMTAVRPQITKTYASGELESMHRLIVMSSKMSFFLMLILSLPIIYNISTILKWWLGIVPDYTSQFVIVMLISSMVRSLAVPLITAIHATGNIMRFQIWEGTVLLLVVPVAYLLLRTWSIGPIAVMSVYLFIELAAQAVRMWVVLPAIRMSFSSYITGVLFRIFIVSLMSVAVLSMLHQIAVESIVIRTLLSVVVSLLWSAFTVYGIGLNRHERTMAMSSVRRVANKIKGFFLAV